MAKLTTVTAAEHKKLRESGALDPHYWDSQPDADKPSYDRFKAEVKRYYRGQQALRCCYCSSDLADDQGSFDAEHVLDKSTHPEFMFELNNLAASCKPCNRAKSAKPVLADGVPSATVPLKDTDYKIVHPHLDVWDDYLTFDQYNRIRPKRNRPKGIFTIRTCGINAINATRLARLFDKDNRATAEDLLQLFFRYVRLGKKQDCINLLRKLAGRQNLKASAVIGRLEEEMIRENEQRLIDRRRHQQRQRKVP